MNNSVRKSPTASATLYKTGTKKKGNDGNIWIVNELANGVKRWKIFKKPSKIIKTVKLKSKKFRSSKFRSSKSKSKKIKPTSISKKRKSKSVAKTAQYDITNNKFQITQLGKNFLDFMSDESLFPKSPDDVKEMSKNNKEIWKIMNELNLIGIVEETKFEQETYYITGKTTFIVNIMCELDNRKKYFYEPAKLKESGIQEIYRILKSVNFVKYIK